MTNEMIKKSEQTAPFQMTTFDEAMRFAKAIANSDLAPKDFKGKPDNVLVAIQMGHELGLKPMQAIQNIAVVNGRPTVWGDAALALVRGNPECQGVREWIDGSIKSGNAIAYCEVKRNKEVIIRSFSVAQATQAGLLNKAGTWTQYPERMLQMRARGFALRDAFPDVLKGVYIEGEMEGVVESETVEQQKESPRLGLQAVKNAITQATDTIAKHVDAESPLHNIDSKSGEIKQQDDGAPTYSDVLKKMQDAKTVDDLILAADAARAIHKTKEQHDELAKIYIKKQIEVTS